MARQQKRLKKKELREDPIMEGIAKSQLWLSENGKALGIAVLVIAVVVVGVVMLRNMSAEADLESRRALAQAQLQIQQTGGEDMITPLLKVADEYEGSSGGAEALFTAAELALAEDDYDRAIELYERFIDEYGREFMLYAGAKGGLATAYENKQQYEKAAGMYEDLASARDAEHYRYYALLSAGRAYRHAEMYDKAREMYETVLDEQEFSDYRTRAEEELARLDVVQKKVGLP